MSYIHFANNNVTYIYIYIYGFHNVIQDVPLGWEIVNKAMYVFKDLDIDIDAQVRRWIKCV